MRISDWSSDVCSSDLVEALAARQHGDRHLTAFGGGEDEFHMRRRFLQRLQQAVEGRRRQHMDLFDDVALVARPRGGIAHRLDDIADVADAGTRRAVTLRYNGLAVFPPRLTVLHAPGWVVGRQEG